MEQGLAASMMYGDGSGNTITHSYGGSGSTPKRSVSKNKVKSKKNKESDMACKKKPGKK